MIHWWESDPKPKKAKCARLDRNTVCKGTECAHYTWFSSRKWWNSRTVWENDEFQSVQLKWNVTACNASRKSDTIYWLVLFRPYHRLNSTRNVVRPRWTRFNKNFESRASSSAILFLVFSFKVEMLFGFRYRTRNLSAHYNVGLDFLKKDASFYSLQSS